MKAMVLEQCGPVESNPLKLKDIEVPEPGPGRVLIRVSACGICHTDLHVIEAEIETHKLPLVIGHQIVGEVEKLGRGVTAWKPGDKVGVPWLNKTCGKCYFCKHDMENLCEDGKFTGYDVDGGLAEYTVQDADWIYAIPEGYPDLEAAPLLCAGIIGFRALRLSDIEKGGVLGLVGFGASAHVTIQVARHRGCEVYVFTRSQEHRDHAMKLGAAWAGGIEDKAPGPCDSAVIFAPAGPLVPATLGKVRKGGTVALAGIYMTPIPEFDYNTLLYYERTLRSVANSTRQDCRELLKIAPEVPIKTEVTEFPPEDANRALNLLKKSKIRGAGVIKFR
jgi:propanol-preferring alcohol dehydrogenase